MYVKLSHLKIYVNVNSYTIIYNVKQSTLSLIRKVYKIDHIKSTNWFYMTEWCGV